ncbi:glycosyltransferase family 2 protein [Spongiibacter taiwanensis]|uniref:glycosyltransferase family 2 protein n=1 Tax=Spongiibacter taiwanensis TaxID=1748242 RepID=UPI002035340F|nr:glycosyltransferase [Spongiibacter taiwanensis]USA42266.1 glycosyltransferase family 2 protein [Spongiibacter taiwanensis]
MYELINSAIEYVEASLAMLFALSPTQLVMLLWPFLLLSVPRYLLTEFVALFQAMRPEPRAKAAFRRQLQANPPFVSILLPGFNERDTLETTVLSLREQTYPNFEIIVVNDGSTDGMGEVGRKLARRGWVRYFEHRMRGGKSSAANFALNAARGEYVVICDADSTFDRDSIWHLLVEFYRPDVAAVAGNLRVRNADSNLLTRMQAMQYVFSIGLGRRVSAMLGILFIVSGAFGAVRRSTLVNTGGWETGPGEDGDVTVKARIAGGDVAFAPEAMCMTDAPDAWWPYYRQQLRWNRSLIRFNVRKYGWLFNPFRRPFDVRNLIANIDTVLYQLVLGLTFPFYVVWMYMHHSEIFFQLMLVVLILYTAINYLHFLVALALSERPMVDLKMFPYVPLYGFFMGFYLRVVRLIAYADEYFFRTSYRESYVPEHVQKQSRMYDPW